MTSRLNFDRKILAAFVTAWVTVLALAAITWRLSSDVDTSAQHGRNLAIIFGSLFILALTAVLLGSYFWVQRQWRVMREQNEALEQSLNEQMEFLVLERTRQLEVLSRSKPDLLANMSHELRSPLNVVIGFSEMLKDGMLGELDPKQQDAVSDIYGSGKHLLALINDILNLSKVQTEAFEIQTDVIDLPALLKGSLQMVKQQAINERIGLDIYLDPSLGPMVGDERKIKQILYELLSNAVSLTPAGGCVSLRARRVPLVEPLSPLPAEASGECLAITVEDGSVASRQGQGSHFCVWLPFHAAPP